jgi:uncharacterized protein with HEPN domain
MSNRDWTLFIKDIDTCAAKVLPYTKDMCREEFFADSKTFDAVIRNPQIIGEAAKKLPPDIKRQYKTVEWKKIASLRDIVVHDYFGINEDIIWDVICNKIPELKQSTELILKTLASNNLLPPYPLTPIPYPLYFSP